MTVYFDKIRKEWKYDFWKNGRRFSNACLDEDGRPAKTKTQATEYELKLKAMVAKKVILSSPTINQGNYTLAQAMAAYASKAKHHDNWVNIKKYISELLAYFKPDKILGELGDADLRSYIEWSRSQKIKIFIGGPKVKGEKAQQPQYWKETNQLRDDATTNRHLATLRTAMKIAHKERDPLTKKRLLPDPIDIPNLKEKQHIPRPIGEGHLASIISVVPDYLADAISLTVHMGFRKKEVFGLRRHHFDRERRGVWLGADETKGDRGEFIEANDFAFAILDRLDKAAEKRDDEWLIVFTPRIPRNAKPRPIKNPKKAWAKALKELGLKGRYTFHNTKAAFVSALGATNTPKKTIQSLARHKNFQTTERYLATAEGSRRQAVDLISQREGTRSPKQKSQTNKAQKPNKRTKSLR